MRRLLSLAALAVVASVSAGASYSSPLAAAGARSSGTASWALAQIGAAQAWPLVQGKQVPPVGVLDSGVDDAHPDLAGKVTAARDFVDASGDVSDSSWHGTAVAGVVSGTSTSVCPSCTIVSARVLNSRDEGSDAEIARALLWAVGNGARVVNLSMAGADESPALRAAITTATRHGVVVVAAAGNAGSTARSYPAADPNVIGVAATSSTGRLYQWSNHGRWVTIAAPGEMMTTLRGGGYTTFVGTSAAAPAVAAAAAECLAVAPNLTPAEVRRIIVRTAVPVRGMSFGRLDAGRAVAACAAP
ncbi:MAG TPA: S8 family serine peptidase [Gaiellaceae bacterium]|nr:S8 family serine peptidase [Gaiellaceae bacterium]